MSENCPTCLRPIATSELQPGTCHKRIDRQEWRVTECFNVGIAARDALLGAAQTRARQLLDLIDSAIAHEDSCSEPTSARDQGPLSAPVTEHESDSATGPAESGGPSTSSPETIAAPEASPTSAGPAKNFAKRRLLCCGWLLESFDMGFRVGRQISKDGVHVVLTVDEDAAEGWEVPVEAMGELLGKELS